MFALARPNKRRIFFRFCLARSRNAKNERLETGTVKAMQLISEAYENVLCRPIGTERTFSYALSSQRKLQTTMARSRGRRCQQARRSVGERIGATRKEDESVRSDVRHKRAEHERLLYSKVHLSRSTCALLMRSSKEFDDDDDDDAQTCT